VGKTGATGQTATVLADDLIDLFHSVVTGYRASGSWLMRDATLASIRKIKTGESGSVQYLWQPGLQAGAPDTILGRPVVTAPSMPTMAANAYSILFGDFSRHYVVRDVQGVRFERSDDYAFATDQITFRALLRTDGKRVDLTAVKAYRNSAT
jgi:HK97 family phage major capsid protein